MSKRMNWRYMTSLLYRGVFAALVIVAVLGSSLFYGRWTGQLPGFLLAILLQRIDLPTGFTIELYATGVPNVRSLTLGADGTVFAGSRRAGRVYALLDRHHRNKADDLITIARDQNMPTGVAFRDGDLYVAEVDRILCYHDIEARLRDPPTPIVVTDGLPAEREHGSRFIRFGPDGWLYVSVGAPCDVCEPKDERFAAILRTRPDGSHLESFARGVRSSVGFDWDPQTNELWFTDNGRDSLGEDRPPDELNAAPSPGMNFGFPYCHGEKILDPQFGQGHACTDFVGPTVELPAHVAPLGMRFYKGSLFPRAYHNQIFIAEHGSWDRQIPTGDRISLVRPEDPIVKYEVFAEGWQLGRFRWGRPVDVLEMPDGALLVSDDYAGAVYRITYHQQ
jgi:glucose/arabinose dehydrogenase